MTETVRKELVEEIKHLGKIPKPLIIDTNYIIIDGEHTYKASKELKLKELQMNPNQLNPQKGSGQGKFSVYHIHYRRQL